MPEVPVYFPLLSSDICQKSNRVENTLRFIKNFATFKIVLCIKVFIGFTNHFKVYEMMQFILSEFYHHYLDNFWSR